MVKKRIIYCPSPEQDTEEMQWEGGSHVLLMPKEPDCASDVFLVALYLGTFLGDRIRNLIKLEVREQEFCSRSRSLA